MPDREKVIKGLEVCLKNIDQQDCPNDCPYLNDCSKYENRVVFQPLMYDALDLLKEQDAKEGHWIVLEFCANEGIYCSECHMKIFDRTTKPKRKLSQYCPHCGSRNEQFFRNGEVAFR